MQATLREASCTVCRLVMTAEESAGFRRGEPDAVRSVYRDYGGLVFAVALEALGRRDLAEEATRRIWGRALHAASNVAITAAECAAFTSTPTSGGRDRFAAARWRVGNANIVIDLRLR